MPRADRRDQLSWISTLVQTPWITSETPRSRAAISRVDGQRYCKPGEFIDFGSGDEKAGGYDEGGCGRASIPATARSTNERHEW